MRKLRIEIPATSANLGPGFDALGLALDLTDTITAELDPHTNTVTLDSVSSEDGLTLDPEANLLCEAYRRWGDDTGKPLPGVRFTLQSRVPAARGLGSSAASIVGGLVAAAYAQEEKHPQARLLDLATDMEGHPDNAVAAIMGGMTVAFREGREVRALHVANHMEMGVALFIPSDGFRTREARACLPKEVPLPDAVYNLGRAAYLTTAILWGRWECLGDAMQDRLHQPYRARFIPALDAVIAAARGAGAYGAALSGAGPTVIALTPVATAEDVRGAMETCAAERSWEGRGLLLRIRESGFQVTEVKEDGETKSEA
jgi:homoserine kinase